MNANELKTILKMFKDTNFQHPGNVDIYTLTNAMLEQIGNTDSELRDSLIYPSLSNLIINGYYPRPELNRILNICLDDDHLFYKIDQKREEDAVFKRAFSSLIIAVLLFVNVKNSFIADEEMDEVATKIMDYVKREEDVRGYVEGKGWAHSIAHIADTLDELVKQPQLKEERFREIALLIIEKMSFDQDYFLFEEDERMVIPMISLLQRGLDDTFLYEEIDKLTNELQQSFVKDGVKPFIQRTNVKQFLRSLFLHLEVINKQEELREHVKKALISINQPYYNL
ncbi:DUF2785 domain-containing protein [Paucisalibacillus globulus]|jgi:Protein of unknown function (DUF2785)|uniref:DUF2785 domain-containing protein n=1 Tax=Paucisalibacillus globulus TaxID=351095 RepID=UPI000BB851F5|nr:DUF2785 domain-containing protein [Paucisalibacillus globulus]